MHIIVDHEPEYSSWHLFCQYFPTQGMMYALFFNVNHIKDSSLAGHHDKIILTAFFEASTYKDYHLKVLRFGQYEKLSIVDPKHWYGKGEY